MKYLNKIFALKPVTLDIVTWLTLFLIFTGLFSVHLPKILLFLLILSSFTLAIYYFFYEKASQKIKKLGSYYSNPLQKKESLTCLSLLALAFTLFLLINNYVVYKPLLQIIAQHFQILWRQTWYWGLFSLFLLALMVDVFINKKFREQEPLPATPPADRNTKHELESGQRYFQLLDNYEATTDFNQDLLEREPIAKEIVGLLKEAYEKKSFVLGISGPWGIGKTTLINQVLSLLDSTLHNAPETSEEINGAKRTINKATSRYISIWLESWHYRNPEQILTFLLQEIQTHILKHLPNRETKNNIKNYFQQIAQGLSINFFGVGWNLSSCFKTSVFPDKKTIVENLEKYFHKHILIIIDDLDRVQRDELEAILRAIRALNGLPKLTFILAYDKVLIQNTLFQIETNRALLAIDYLSKIIHLEINIAQITRTIKKRIIEEILINISHYTPDKTLEHFKIFLLYHPLNFAISYLLSNPREIRKILAHTFWLYNLEQENEKQFYLPDLFVLNIIQYRFPDFYLELQLQREKIIACLCRKLGWKTSNLEVYKDFASSREAYNKTLQDLKNNLLKKEDAFVTIKTSFFEYLFRDLLSEEKEQDSTVFTTNSLLYISALKNRQFYHPEIYETYFTYSYPSSLKNVIDFINNIEKLQKNPKEDLFFQFLNENMEILDNITYWDIFINLIENKNLDIYKIIIKCIAKLSNQLISFDQYNFGPTEMDLYCYKAKILLIEVLNDKPEMSFIEEITNLSPSFGFAYKLLNDFIYLDMKYDYNININLDNFIKNMKDNLVEILDKKAKNYFKNNILKSSYFDLHCFFHDENLNFNDKQKNEIFNEIEKNPNQLFTILNIYILPHHEKQEINTNNLKKLNTKLCCKNLLNSYKNNKISIEEVLNVLQKKQLNALEIYVNSTSTSP